MQINDADWPSQNRWKFSHLWIEIELPRQVVPIRKDADMLCAARNPALLLISMRDVRPERISAMLNLQGPGVSR